MGRFAAVMATAIVGAGVVAGTAAMAMPDHAPEPGGGQTASGSDYADRLLADGRASRDDRKDGTVALEQDAPDVWLLPVVTYHVTSLYGTRWGKLHAGVDMGATEGTPILAAAAGVVTLCRWSSGYGYSVQISHGGGIMSVYGHASKLLCQEGQRVQAGDLIARVGNTGHSFGSHLHFELRQDDKPIEPTAFMKDHGVDILKHAQAVYGDIISD